MQHRSNRRDLLKDAAAFAGVSLVSSEAAAQDGARFAPFDREMQTFMASRGVPGGSVAVARDGKVVYSKGYGWADRDRRTPVQAESLFRIASISKPVTAVAVMRLVEQSKLSLDQPAFAILKPQPVAGKIPDPRLAKITVRQLLEHTGGWDRDKSFDAMFRPTLIAKEVAVPAPAGPEAVIRYMMSVPLDFDPGQDYSYSNFGYCVLGRIIEKVSGRGYEDFVRAEVLTPAGVKSMRLGRTLEADRAPGEVHYYMPRDEKGPSVFPSLKGQAPWPYGAFNLEAMDAHGGWLASAPDLVRFGIALDAPSRLLKPATLRAMYDPPAAPVSRKPDGSVEDVFYGLGWQVRPKADGKANIWHGGSLPGTWTILVRRWDGLTWAALFNLRTDERGKSMSDIDGALHRAANESFGVRG